MKSIKAGEKLAFLKKTALIGLKKILTNQKSFKAGVLISLNALSHYFFSFSREVTVDSARHRCTEGLFKPSVWGKDNPGIHELTVKAIMACSIDMRKQMCRNIYLSGGGSMSPGLFSKVYHN